MKNNSKSSFIHFSLFSLGIGLCLFFLIHIPATILLKSSNEHYSFSEGIEMSLRENSLYGRIVQSKYPYKFVMTTKKKAKLLALGSSRVMQFRSEFFKDISFYNAGGAVPDLKTAIAFIEQLPNDALPKYLILGLDLWWFNDNSCQTPTLNFNIPHSSIFTETLHKEVSILKSRFNRSFKNLVLSFDAVECSNHRAVGATACQFNEGFRTDGSYRYGQILSGISPIDFKFGDTKKRIIEKNYGFESGSYVSQELIQNFMNILELLKKRNVVPIVFLPPFPNEIYNILISVESHKGLMNDFMIKTQLICDKYGVEFHNFSDLSTLNLSDKEVYDGFHGNDIAYARIVQEMGKSGVLAPYVNNKFINEFTKGHLINKKAED